MLICWTLFGFWRAHAHLSILWDTFHRHGTGSFDLDVCVCAMCVLTSNEETKEFMNILDISIWFYSFRYFFFFSFLSDSIRWNYMHIRNFTHVPLIAPNTCWRLNRAWAQAQIAHPSSWTIFSINQKQQQIEENAQNSERLALFFCSFDILFLFFVRQTIEIQISVWLFIKISFWLFARYVCIRVIVSA